MPVEQLAFLWSGDNKPSSWCQWTVAAGMLSEATIEPEKVSKVGCVPLIEDRECAKSNGMLVSEPAPKACEGFSDAPSSEVLLAFARGRLGDAAISQVEGHLDSCSSCSELVAYFSKLSASASAETDDGTTLKPGALVGRYTVRELVGQGAMGVVYQAYDPDLDREVALKLIPGENDPRRDARLVEEARALARLSHPNVISVFEVGGFRGRMFLAMEFVDGVTLSDWLQARPRSRRDILSVFVKAGRGLSAAHEMGLVHRDFKPDNVLVARDGRVLVVDFGLARLHSNMDAASIDADPDSLPMRLTVTGMLVGTLRYMPLEQMRGVAEARSDQFSFCVALWEALCQGYPFPGTTITEIADNIANHRFGASAPRKLGPVLERGLAATADDRYESMHDLLADLEAAVRPRKPRARLSLLIVGLAAVLAAFVLWSNSNAVSLNDNTCAGAGDPASNVWSEQKRRALAKVFLASEFQNASDAWTSVELSLDNYAASWSALQEESCALEQSLPADTIWLSQRQDCLQSGLFAFGHLVTLLADAGEIEIRRAASMAARLPDLEECANTSALASRSEPTAPLEPKAHERAVELEFLDHLARAKVLLDFGRAAEASEEAELALSKANVAARTDLAAKARLVLEAARFKKRSWATVFKASSCVGPPLSQDTGAQFLPEDSATGSASILVASAYYLYSRECTSAACEDWQSDQAMSDITNLTMGVPVVGLQRTRATGTIKARWHGYVKDEWSRTSDWKSLPWSNSYEGSYERYQGDYEHNDDLREARFDMQNTVLTEHCFRSEGFYNTPKVGGSYTQYKWVAYGRTDKQAK